MGIRNFILLGALAIVGCGRNAATDSTTIEVSPLPSAAVGTDYGKGVSALAAGDIDGMLVIAGGANFPATPAAEGGAKRFYDDIFTLKAGAAEWEAAGKLPQPVAYGATFALDRCIIIAGGANAGGSLSEVVSLELATDDTGNEVSISTLPSLPVPIEQAAAARNGEKLYIAGGLSNGEASLGVYACNLADGGEWRMVSELPEPFVQPVAVVTDNYIYVWGGFDPAKKVAADYGFRYDFARDEWSRIEGLPDGGTAVGSTVVQDGNGMAWLMGGVNRDIFNAALNQPAEQSAEYLSQPVDYYNFRRAVYAFDPATESWLLAGECTVAARAGAALVQSSGKLVILNGEEKPGIRSAEINQISIRN